MEAMLAQRRAEHQAAWQRFVARYPRRAKAVRRRLDNIAKAFRQREAARSEGTRVIGVIRSFYLRVGEVTGLGDDVFFLPFAEMLALLEGEDAATAFIPARRATHERYSALPPYPAVINGRFDPFQWAADPQRRHDLYDAHASVAGDDSTTISGFAGAAGEVEGTVRVIDDLAVADQLRPGEILVTATTNIGWTPVFPRAAAVVTDVGAPLSHAAIVARELGVPAVVGTGDATTRLRTGDRVRVNGGQGTVILLDEEGENG